MNNRATGPFTEKCMCGRESERFTETSFLRIDQFASVGYKWQNQFNGLNGVSNSQSAVSMFHSIFAANTEKLDNVLNIARSTK